MDGSALPLPQLISHELLSRSEFRLLDAEYDEWVLMLLTSGSFVCRMRGEERLMKAGDAVIFPRGVCFQRRVTETLEMHYFVFEWSCGDDLLKESGLWRCGYLPTGAPARMAENDRRLRSLTLREDKLAQAVRAQVLCDIWLTHLCAVTAGGGERTGDALMLRAADFIGRALSEGVSAADTAAHVGLTPVQLTRRFYAAFEQTPGEYIAAKRLEKARMLLGTDELSIGEISELCGFDNQFYFSSRFKKRYGVCPRDYRKRTP